MANRSLVLPYSFGLQNFTIIYGIKICDKRFLIHVVRVILKSLSLLFLTRFISNHLRVHLNMLYGVNLLKLLLSHWEGSATLFVLSKFHVHYRTRDTLNGLLGFWDLHILNLTVVLPQINGWGSHLLRRRHLARYTSLRKLGIIIHSVIKFMLLRLEFFLHILSELGHWNKLIITLAENLTTIALVPILSH